MFAGRPAESAREVFALLSGLAEQATGHEPALEPEPRQPTNGRLRLGDITIDVGMKEVRLEGREVQLTPIERSCLVAFAATRAGR